MNLKKITDFLRYQCFANIEDLYYSIKIYWKNRKQLQKAGQCNMCGTCCRNLHLLERNKVIRSKKQWLRIQERYPIYKIFKIETETKNGLVFRCSKISEDNTCSIYEQRPPVCRRYPKKRQLIQHPEEFKHCGFYLAKKHTFKEELEYKIKK